MDVGVTSASFRRLKYIGKDYSIHFSVSKIAICLPLVESSKRSYPRPMSILCLCYVHSSTPYFLKFPKPVIPYWLVGVVANGFPTALVRNTLKSPWLDQESSENSRQVSLLYFMALSHEKLSVISILYALASHRQIAI